MNAKIVIQAATGYKYALPCYFNSEDSEWTVPQHGKMVTIPHPTSWVGKTGEKVVDWRYC